MRVKIPSRGFLLTANGITALHFTKPSRGFWTYLVKEGRMLRISGQKAVLIAEHIDVLRIRRQKETPDILEVQIEAQKNVSLISNLRIRISH